MNTLIAAIKHNQWNTQQNSFRIDCYSKYIDNWEGLWKIAIPSAIINQMIAWYHEVLGHCEVHCLYDTIHQHFYDLNVKTLCNEYKCAICQNKKLLGAGYGPLPPRHANLVP